MSRNEAPPFELGQTYFQGNTPDTTVGNHLLGKVWVFEDINLAASGTGGTMKPRRTGVYRYMMAVRNTSGGLLVPKRVAKMYVAGSLYEFTQEVSGYATTVGELCFPIDEFLPSSGVADDDIFWVCVQGPAKVTSGAGGDTTVAIGEYVIPTTDGKVIGQDTTVAAGAATFAQVFGAVGVAITAVAAINTDFIILVTPKGF